MSYLTLVIYFSSLLLLIPRNSNYAILGLLLLANTNVLSLGGGIFLIIANLYVYGVYQIIIIIRHKIKIKINFIYLILSIILLSSILYGIRSFNTEVFFKFILNVITYALNIYIIYKIIDFNSLSKVVSYSVCLIFSFSLIVFFISGLNDGRLTTMISPQSLSIYYLLSLVFLIENNFRKEIRLKNPYLFAVVLAMFGIILAQSRFVYMLTVLYIMYWSYRYFVLKRPIQYKFIYIFVLAFITLSSYLLLLQAETYGNRLSDVLLLFSGDSLDEIGTLSFRFNMYYSVLSRISSFDLLNHLFGAGIGSAADIILSGEVYYRGYTVDTIDPIRLVHNEFLRFYYEMGVIGFTGLIVVLYKFWHLIANDTKYYYVYVIFICYLLIENVITASGTPSGIMLALIIGSLIKLQDVRYIKVSK